MIDLPVLILLSSLIPAVLTFCIAEMRARLRNALNLGAALVKSALVVALLMRVLQGELFEVRLTLLPGIDFLLHADAWSLLFISLSSLLWLITTLYAIGYLAHAAHRSRFFGFFSLCVFSTAGIALSGNLITFLIFYELLTLATYPLVVHKGTPESLRAGRKYLAYTLGGGALFLTGAAWLTAVAGPVEFSATGVLAQRPELSSGVLQGIFWLLIAGLGVKAALVPFHGWLPAAMVAPAPVSALLHAVAVVKAGAFGISRIVYDVYGVEFAAQLGLTAPLVLIASFTILYGSVCALFQDGLKRRLAFSTVSQVSYIMLGTAIAGPIATVGGIVHLVHQGLMKITLFFCAGNLDETLGIHKVSEMHGVGRRMPWTMAAFTLAALGMIGIPPLAGFVSKWYLGFGALATGSDWLILVLVGSSLLNAAYFLPILYVAWFCAPASDRPFPTRRGRLEAHWMLLVPPLATAALTLLAGLLAKSVFSPLEWAKLIAAREYDQVAIVELSFTQPQWLILASLLAPLLGALAAAVPRWRHGALRLLPWAALPGLGLALFPVETTSVLSWLFLGSVLQLDDLGRTFLLFTALLWLLCGLYTRGYLRDDPHRGRFAAFFLLAMLGNFGLILAADASSFVVFFTLMSLASYALVIHRGDQSARHAGRLYIRLVIVGELCLFAAIVSLAQHIDNLRIAELAQVTPDPWTVGLLIVGFGIKAGLLPLHVWLPQAHPVAPAPASAVLSGAMVAAGLLGWLRFLPLGLPGGEAWGMALTVLGLLGAFYGALIGILQTQAKTVLAYSTISQMGLMSAGVGMVLWQPALAAPLVPALALYALHHGLAKGALFLATATVAATPRQGPGRWLSVALLLFPALAIVGAPLTSGALAKAALKLPLEDSSLTLLLPVLTVAAVASTLLMLRFLQLSWPRKDPVQAFDLFMQAGWVGCVLLVIFLPWGLGFFQAASKALAISAFWSQLWPMALGLGLAGAIWHSKSRLPSWLATSPTRWTPTLVASEWRFLASLKALPARRPMALQGPTAERLQDYAARSRKLAMANAQTLSDVLFGAVLLGVLLTLL